jgi:hypothetical protein
MRVAFKMLTVIPYTPLHLVIRFCIKAIFSLRYIILTLVATLCSPHKYTVDPRKSNGLILEQLETRKKMRFETRIKIRKSNHECGIAQHRAAHGI